ncbi:MAG: DNA cytosine methyltransferase [Bacteroides sp.]
MSKVVGILCGDKWDTKIDYMRRIYDVEDTSPTIATVTGGGMEVKIAEPSGLYLNCSTDYFRGELEGLSRTIKSDTHPAGIVEPVIGALRGRNPDNPTGRESGLTTEQMLEIKNDGTSNTLTTVQKDNMVVEPGFRIRKLTPLECWRLMGFDDEDFFKAQSALNKQFYGGKNKSSSQLYKMAGNSIVVQVLEAIFRPLF